MKITTINFLTGWNGTPRIKVNYEDGDEAIMEADEAKRIILAALAHGARRTLAPGQKLYRVSAAETDERSYQDKN